MIENPIKARRKARGLSQRGMGLLIGISSFYIDSWEKGQSLPCEKRMIQIAKILGITGEILREELDQFYETRGNALQKLLRAGSDIKAIKKGGCVNGF